MPSGVSPHTFMILSLGRHRCMQHRQQQYGLSPRTAIDAAAADKGTPLQTVNQCAQCGALTMLQRCPNCDYPAVSSGTADTSGAAQRTPKTTRIGFVTGGASIGEPMLFSPTAATPASKPALGAASRLAAVERAGAPADPSQYVPSSRSPSTGIRPPTTVPTPTAAAGSATAHGHVAGQPVPVVRAVSPNTHRSVSPSTSQPPVSDVTAAQLRRDVQRLSAELHKRTFEAEQLHQDLQSKASNRHELQELWHTLRQQSESLNQAKLVEEELQQCKSQLRDVQGERDRLRTELEASRLNAVTGEGLEHQIEELRSELHRKHLETLDLEHSVESARRQAREAEALLQQHKMKVQQTTAEVLELQRHVESTRREDQERIRQLEGDVDRLEKELLTAREDAARASHELQLAGRSHTEERRKLEREVSALRTNADEMTRLEELLKEHQERLRVAHDELRTLRSELRDTKLSTDAIVHERVLQAERDYDAQLTAARRNLADARNETRKLEFELDSLRHAVDDSVEASQQLQAERDALKNQVDVLSDENRKIQRQLDTEARAASDLRRQLEELRAHGLQASEDMVDASIDSTRHLTTLRRELAEATARLRDVPQLELQIDSLKKRETELMLEVNRSKMANDTALQTALAEADRRVNEARQIEKQRAADMQTTIDELRSELSSATEAIGRQTAQHAISISELRSRYAELSRERDELVAQNTRLTVSNQKFSPEQVASEKAMLQQQLESAQREADRLTSAQRETQAYCDALRRDLAQARERVQAAQAAIDDRDAFTRALREIIAPSVSRMKNKGSSGAGLQQARGTMIFSIDEEFVAVQDADLLAQVRALISLYERTQETATVLQERVDGAVAMLDAQISELTQQRDAARQDASIAMTRIQELEKQQQQALAQAESRANARLREVYDEMHKEHEALKADLAAAQASLAGEREEKSTALEELRAVNRQHATERDAVAQAAHAVEAERDALRRDVAESEHRITVLQRDVQVLQTELGHAEQRLKDARRAAQVAAEEKEQYKNEVAAVRASIVGDIAEAEARLEDQRVKYTRENEALKATLRMEREKILKEIEKTHSSEARASDLELLCESLKAERERLSKELELARQFQSSRLDVFHANVDAVTKERDELKRSVEECNRKLATLEIATGALRNENASLDLSLREVSRERDNLSRQLQLVQSERDGALRFMSLASGTVGSGGGSRPASPTRFDRTGDADLDASQHPLGGSAAPGRKHLLQGYESERLYHSSTTPCQSRRVSPSRIAPQAAVVVPPMSGTPRSGSVRTDALPLSAFRR